MLLTIGRSMLCRSLTHGRDILDTKVKWAVVGLALVMVVVLGVLMVHRAAFSTELNSDFMTYRAAGWAVLTGSDIYEAQNSRGWPYVYPPPFAGAVGGITVCCGSVRHAPGYLDHSKTPDMIC